MHIVSDHIGDPSYYFKHTYMYVFIKKHNTLLISTIKHTQPTNNWELVTGTCNGILVFRLTNLNLKGSLGKGTKREENP